MDKKPEKITLTNDEAIALKLRMDNNELSDSDKKIINGLISFNLWLAQQLQFAKLSIHRLKTLFGIKTEKKKLT